MAEAIKATLHLSLPYALWREEPNTVKGVILRA